MKYRYLTLGGLVLAAAASYLLAQQPNQPQKKGQAANNPSVIQIMDTKDMSTRVVFKTPLHFEAPNCRPTASICC